MSNFYWHDKDPHDERIRQTLKEWEEAPPAQWDVPPPGLWDKIASTAPAKASANASLAVWLKWLLGVALVGGITVTGVWYFTQVKQSVPSQVPTTAEDTAPTLLVEHALAEASTTRPNMPATSAALLEQSRASNCAPIVASQPASTLVFSNSNHAAFALSAPATYENEEDVSVLVTIDAEQTPEQLREVALPFIAESTPGDKDAPAQVETTLMPLPDEEHVLPATLLAVPTLLEMAAVPPIHLSSTLAGLDAPSATGFARRSRQPVRFCAGTAVAANHTFRKITASVRPVSQLPPYLRDNEFATWTGEWGLRLGWRPARRLWLGSGVSLYSIGQQSRHVFRIPFDPGRERPGPNGERQGQYNLTVPSSYGDAGVVVSIQRSAGQHVPPGQLLVVRMQTDLHIRYATLPLSGYYFPLWGRFSAGVKGGVALNFLQEQRLNARISVAARGLSARIVSAQQTEELLQRTLTDYHIGAALWYRPALGWAIALEPSYRHSLGPVIRREFFNVDQHAWSIQMGVQKFF